MTVVNAVVLVITSAAAAVGTLRWLRVAQREHYLVGGALRISGRWWASSPENTALGITAAAAAIGTAFWPPVAVVAAAICVLAPLRLSLKGRTSRLHWTRRLTTVAAVTGALEAVAVAFGAIGGGITGAVTAAALVAVLSPAATDLALVLTRPFEETVARRFVRQATDRLGRVRPVVVGVTGSYGKTTVKGYIAHVVGPYKTTLASPQSFNNRGGLTRTVNEFLGPATEVLVAEMGTYGPGEIADLCSWLRPEISVITAIGPAHLERFKSLDRTLAAKAEICETASTVVLNVDDERLAGLAAVMRTAGKRVVEASGTNPVAGVAVLEVGDGLELHVEGRRVGVAAVPASDRPTALSNAACAAAVALELGVPAEDVLARLPSLPVPANRLQRYQADGGYTVLDDTFNSNPAGARLGLAKLRQEAPNGRKAVVTPGMVELGREQAPENASLGEAAARVADWVVVVARTNRAAIEQGARRAPGECELITVDRLDEALDWIRLHLGPGDAVLYENDLPDHFP